MCTCQDGRDVRTDCIETDIAEVQQAGDSNNNVES